MSNRASDDDDAVDLDFVQVGDGTELKSPRRSLLVQGLDMKQARSLWPYFKGPTLCLGFFVLLLLLLIPLNVVSREASSSGGALFKAVEAVWLERARAMAAARAEWPACNSMFLHSCGTLLAQSDGSSFGALYDMNERVEQSLESIAADGWPMMGNWYAACMNVSGRKLASSLALQPMTDAIEAVRDATTLARAIAVLRQYDVRAMLDIDVAPGFNNTNVNVLYLDAPTPMLVGSNTSALAALLAPFMGRDQVLSALLFESRVLVPAALSAAARRAAVPVVTRLSSMSTMRNLRADLAVQNLAINANQALVFDPTYLRNVDSALAFGNWPDVRAYLVYRMVARFYEDLPGMASVPNCVDSLEWAFGDVLGHYYVAQNFPGSSKQDVDTMVNYSIAAFRSVLASTDWLDTPTLDEALLKLDSVHTMVGYPDQFGYGAMPALLPAGYLASVLAAAKMFSGEELAQAGAPVDKAHWLMRTFTVNAYYSSGTIAVPAGILQGPFYHPDAPLESKYGGIGTVIGHEITHAFDDHGCMYDSQGMRRNWWSAGSRSAYQARAQCVSATYSAAGVDGNLTLGESIADSGGIRIALAAYQAHFEALYPSARDKRAYEQTVRDVFKMSREQLFFSSYAFAWCSRQAPAPGDPHPPAKLRVDLTLSRFVAFCKQYGCSRRNVDCHVW